MPVLTLDPASAADPRHLCSELESGAILFFPQTPIPLPEADLHFLLGQEQTSSSLHKNIAYKPATSTRPARLSGTDASDPAVTERLTRIMENYSTRAAAFVRSYLAPYGPHIALDYASFRPQEEHSRDLPTRRRNDLLHTDAFPTRPTRGARILRFFSNIHPTRTRDWVVGDPFAATVAPYAPAQIAPQPDTAATRALKSVARATGLTKAVPSLKRTPYDDFMMRFHNFLKENTGFQADSPKHPFSFAPGSSWMVYTDTVPHAVLAGQYALEQTFLVAPEAMVTPDHSPLRILERIAGQPLV